MWGAFRGSSLGSLQKLCSSSVSLLRVSSVSEQTAAPCKENGYGDTPIYSYPKSHLLLYVYAVFEACSTDPKRRAVRHTTRHGGGANTPPMPPPPTFLVNGLICDTINGVRRTFTSSKKTDVFVRSNFLERRLHRLVA